MDMSLRVVTGARLLTSILPPRWRRKTGSETLRTRTPGTSRTRLSICSPWVTFRALTVMSRVIAVRLELTVSMAPMSPSTSPMAEVMTPSMPARLGYWARMVML